jgi:hypothetical protein
MSKIIKENQTLPEDKNLIIGNFNSINRRRLFSLEFLYYNLFREIQMQFSKGIMDSSIILAKL